MCKEEQNRRKEEGSKEGFTSLITIGQEEEEGNLQREIGDKTIKKKK